MKAEGVGIDVVSFTPHDWEESQPYVNAATGWTATDIKSFASETWDRCSMLERGHITDSPSP
jgi:hypothetical protein